MRRSDPYPEATLAFTYLQEGKFADGEMLAREAVAIGVKENKDALRTFVEESVLGAALSGQNKYAEAEPVLLGAYRKMLAAKDVSVQDREIADHTLDWIVGRYEGWGKPELAEKWENGEMQ